MASRSLKSAVLLVSYCAVASSAAAPAAGVAGDSPDVASYRAARERLVAWAAFVGWLNESR
jgi:hypothetical protein